MKILVSIKRVPDPYAKVRLDANGNIDETDFSWVINPFDEIALEEAVRIRESGLSVEIVAVSIGTSEWDTQLKTALAMGADRAILVLDDEPSDPGTVSHLLAAVARREQPDLILMGKQATDDDLNQTVQRLAAILDFPQATFASAIQLAPDGKRARVTREVDAGRETLEITLPAVISADLRLNEPRYVALPAIIKARSKPLEQIPASEFDTRRSIGIHTIKMEMPPRRSAGRKVQSVDELVTIIQSATGRN